MGRPRERDLVEEARLLRLWADNKEAVVLREFAAIRGYSSQMRMREYCEICPEFDEAHNYAKLKIGIRRETKVLNGGNSAAFNRYAALYDPDLKSYEEEKSKKLEDSILYQLVRKVPFDADNGSAN